MEPNMGAPPHPVLNPHQKSRNEPAHLNLPGGSPLNRKTHKGFFFFAVGVLIRVLKFPWGWGASNRHSPNHRWGNAQVSKNTPQAPTLAIEEATLSPAHAAQQHSQERTGHLHAA